jgi:hypothetical protein
MTLTNFSFTLRPGANRMPIEDLRFTENGEPRIARIERVLELADGSQVVTGIAFEDIYGHVEFLPELDILSSYMAI